MTALAIDPKDDGAVALSGDSVLRRSIDNPHPEISFRTLFLPVWYEGYAAPKWVWQSTGGSDAFEPKLSVWPLIFGTLKATLYAMLFSLPLALLAASLRFAACTSVAAGDGQTDPRAHGGRSLGGGGISRRPVAGAAARGCPARRAARRRRPATFRRAGAGPVADAVGGPSTSPSRRHRAPGSSRRWLCDGRPGGACCWTD